MNPIVVRAILGGTGRYMGARGQLTSTRNADGTYIAGVHAAKVMQERAPDWRELLLWRALDRDELAQFKRPALTPN